MIWSDRSGNGQKTGNGEQGTGNGKSPELPASLLLSPFPVPRSLFPLSEQEA